MSRLETIFENKDKILNIYFTAGYPCLDSTVEIMKSLQEHGADIIELGMPYSDPLADGPVIQKSSSVAIKNGMTISKLFDQLKDFRKEIHLPVILMGYLNPVIQYGFERFCSEAAAIGIDGLIIPDLPEHEFENRYDLLLNKYGLDFIFLVTPETSEQRVKKLDSLSTGFLYAVSSSSTTGSGNNRPGIEAYLARLKNYNLRNPLLVGFGISNKNDFQSICQFAKGAIVGSAYLKALENSRDVNSTTKSFLSSLLG